MGRSTGAGKGTPAAWRRRRRIAVYEAPALAVFLGILPLSVFAATAAWAFDGDRERRFLLLMVCLGPAALGVLVLGLYVLLRGMLRPADVVAGALYDESAGAGLPPALPRTGPGRVAAADLGLGYGVRRRARRVLVPRRVRAWGGRAAPLHR
ncbi:hypothetical protein ACIQIG_22410 [Streptomyces bacillaris]|uniref:hypothetical protein n=1 Tax=Streptomyces bacillaris TaxID=68179 RepID=UPI00346096DB